MRILHYFLGFPPFRTGGLTNFAYDLMREQSNRGHEVSALWPGQIEPFRKSVSIVARKAVEHIHSYEILNPLPVPFDEGIVDIERYTMNCESSCFTAFLKRLAPDVIHIHTLMGLHQELIEAANALHIRTVFTTHDYFGLCPKVTLFRNGDICRSAQSCEDCAVCDRSALSYPKIVMLQSHLYMKLKDSPLVKKMRRAHRSSFFEETKFAEEADNSGTDRRGDYQRLRSYYTGMLEKMDLIHFNSSVSETIYRSFITPKDGILLSISNKDIVPHDGLKKTSSEKLRFTFLSPAKQYKGYTLVKSAFDRLWQEGQRDFVLNLYTTVPKVEPYMCVHEQGFARDELATVFEQTDCLLAPSIWYETYGFTVLEALSYRTPVIVSNRVGAKDIVGDNGVIIDLADYDSLYYALQKAKDLCVSNIDNLPFWEDYVTKNQMLYQA